jgi:DNA-binding CsgD family transcriptional regulator
VAAPVQRLSGREFEVFQLIGRGKGTRDIAGFLHLSVKTVEMHCANLKKKLELKTAHTWCITRSAGWRRNPRADTPGGISSRASRAANRIPLQMPLQQDGAEKQIYPALRNRAGNFINLKIKNTG